MLNTETTPTEFQPLPLRAQQPPWEGCRAASKLRHSDKPEPSSPHDLFQPTSAMVED